jgi:hypothetical protein
VRLLVEKTDRDAADSGACVLSALAILYENCKADALSGRTFIDGSAVSIVLRCIEYIPRPLYDATESELHLQLRKSKCIPE